MFAALTSQLCWLKTMPDLGMISGCSVIIYADRELQGNECGNTGIRQQRAESEVWQRQETETGGVSHGKNEEKGRQKQEIGFCQWSVDRQKAGQEKGGRQKENDCEKGGRQEKAHSHAEASDACDRRIRRETDGHYRACAT